MVRIADGLRAWAFWLPFSISSPLIPQNPFHISLANHTYETFAPVTTSFSDNSFLSVFAFVNLSNFKRHDFTTRCLSLPGRAEADILLVQGLPPDSDYRFKHALIQDAAYENLLKSRRRALHRRIGEVLLDQFPTIAATEPELLAHHFTQAALTEAAIEWWGKAGQRSLERSALIEAAEL